MAEISSSEIKLVLTGTDESASKSIEDVSKAVSGLGEVIARTMQSIVESSAKLVDFGRAFSDAGASISKTSGTMTRFGSNVNKQAEQISRGTEDIVKSMDGVVKSSADISSQVTHSFASMASAMRETTTATNSVTEHLRSTTQALRTQTEATNASANASKRLHSSNLEGIIGLQMIGASALATGYKLGEMFVGSIKSAMNFQAMMSRVGAALKTTGGDTAQNIKSLSALAMQLDQTSKYSMNEIGDMMQALAKQGLSYQDIYKGAARATITLAQATDASLSDTGTVLTDVMHEFGLKGSQLTPVVNAISGAMHQANISMTDFYNSMKFAGPMASNLKMSVTDVSTAIGLLAQHGIKGSQAKLLALYGVIRNEKLGEFRGNRNVQSTAILSQAA